MLCAGVLAFAAGCGSGGDETAGNDSTAVNVADGSMESEAENYGEQDADEDKDDKKPKREKATSVEASLALRADLVKPVVAEGTFRARHSAEIRAEIGGKVTRSSAQDGQAVKRGQLLAKIDDREYQVAEAEARADYLQALSLLAIEDDDLKFKEMAETIRDEFADLERLERQGKISRQERYAREVELDVKALKEGKFRLEIAAARSGVSKARAALERARLNLEHTEIRAPFDGVITGFTLTVGQQLNVGEVICNIVDNVNIEAEVGVLEADLAHIEEGRPTLLVVPALGETLRVQVDVVSPQFDRESRTCQVLLRVKNEDGRLRPGMFVRALIAGETFDQRLLVPRAAILTRDGRPLLFKVEDNRAKWLYVQVGASNDNLIEIERVIQGGSLEPGDKVVVSNHLTLAHDASIRVTRTVPSGDPWVSFRRE
jgi:RND family efflux transporter MFP subunit